MKANITTKTFKDGVKSFIDFARVGAIRGEISCPCNKCGHAEWFLVDVVHHHILQHGFLSGYTHWTFHGELDTTPPISQPASVLDTSPVIDDIRGLVRDALGVNSLDLKSEESSESRLEGDIDGDIEGYIEEDIEEESEEDIEEESDEDSEEDIGDKDIRYKKLLEECEKELYPGSKYSNLSFTLRLYHIKCMGGISNKIFSMILELIKDASPHLSSLPSSNNEAKKLTNDLARRQEVKNSILTELVPLVLHELDMNLNQSTKDHQVLLRSLRFNIQEQMEDASRNLVVKANKEISRKILELGCPEEEIDNEKRAAIDREVWIDLVGPGGEVLGYGAGVTKSDVTIIESQNRTIASLNKKVEELENTVGGFRDELKLFQTMFQGACGSFDMFFPTQAVSHEGYTGYGKKKKKKKKHSSRKN
ncbi:tetratricopeptide-like helical domain, DYW domain protein [Tanacetum coccineum]